MINVEKLPQPFTKSISSALFKSCAADFIVNEVLDINFTEDGEHLWLKICKTNINTAYLADELARWAKIPARDVGYSGLKDRKGVTTQWFSLRIPKKSYPNKPFESISLNEDESVELIASHWHNKKLNKGTHKFNEFIVTLRQVQAEKQLVEQQLQDICKLGLPNYFGEQRFGRDGDNIDKFLEYVATQKNHKEKLEHKKGKRKKTKNDKSRSILISSARSAIFNEILAKRVTDRTWNTAIEGDIFNLAGSSSVFTADNIDDEIIERINSFDIHPTGCLWGMPKVNNSELEVIDADKFIKNDNTSNSQLQILENEVVNSDKKLKLLATALETLKLKPARRALRLKVKDLKWQWLIFEGEQHSQRTENESVSNIENELTLKLSFKLPTGSYATNLVSSLVKDY